MNADLNTPIYSYTYACHGLISVQYDCTIYSVHTNGDQIYSQRSLHNKVSLTVCTSP